jgi:hypothetical protein
MAKVNPIQLEKYLKGLDYPAKKEDIVHYAEQHGADANVTSALQQLPDKTFDGPTGISKEIGKIDRQAER